MPPRLYPRRLNASRTGIPACQAGRLWRREQDGPDLDDFSVQLNPLAGPETTDSVVFPALSTEGPSSRFFIDPILQAVRGGATSGEQWDVANRGQDSIAFGLDTTASGRSSTIPGGVNSVASGDFTLAAGTNAMASHDGSFVWSDGGSNAASTQIDEVTFGAAGGFRVLGNGGGIPGYATQTIGSVYLDADTVVTGKLTVTGLIDPTGLQCQQQGTSPVGAVAGTGTYWVSTTGDAVYTNSSGVDINLSAGGGGAGAFHSVTNVTKADTGAPGYGTGLNDYVFGSQSLNDVGLVPTQARFLFDKGAGAFRAGRVTSTEWDVRPANSVAFGLNNQVSGLQGGALSGTSNVAGAGVDVVVAGGTSNTAEGNSSGVLSGEFNKAKASHSAIAGGGGVTLGTGNEVSVAGIGGFIGAGGNVGAAAVAKNTVTGVRAVIGGGTDNSADGQDSVVVGGISNTTSGIASLVAAGQGNQAIGNYSFAGGLTSTATGNNSFVWSDSTPRTANNSNEMVLGAAGGFQVLAGGSSLPAYAGSGIYLDGLETIMTGTLNTTGVTNIPSLIVRNAALGTTTLSSASTGFNRKIRLPVQLSTSAGQFLRTTGDFATTNTLEWGSESVVFEINQTPAGTATGGGVVREATTNLFYTAKEDFLFGAQTLNNAPPLSANNGETRMYLAKSNGAFRAGTATGTEWDTGASGAQSAAFGIDCQATGAQAFAMGNGAIASGVGSTAIGALATALGANSTAIGAAAMTTAFVNAVAIGAAAQASADDAIAIGPGAVASGVDSVCLGHNNTAAGADSACLGGTGHTATGSNCVCIGETCTSSANDNQVILAGGNGLDVTTLGTPALADTASRMYCGFTNGYLFYTVAGPTPTVGASLLGGQNTWSMVSDRNKKENLVPMTGVLDRLEKVPLFEYNFIGNPASQVLRGPMAQDWNPLFPNDQDPLFINSGDLNAVALRSIQELAIRMTQQSETIEQQAITIRNHDAVIQTLQDQQALLLHRVDALEK
jgi:hypothetical protein